MAAAKVRMSIWMQVSVELGRYHRHGLGRRILPAQAPGSRSVSLQQKAVLRGPAAPQGGRCLKTPPWSGGSTSVLLGANHPISSSERSLASGAHSACSGPMGPGAQSTPAAPPPHVPSSWSAHNPQLSSVSPLLEASISFSHLTSCCDSVKCAAMLLPQIVYK